MTRIQSKKQKVNRGEKKVYAFLSNLNNLQKLMPSAIKNWTSTSESCRFEIDKMGIFDMCFVEKTPPSLLKIGSQGQSKFAFTFFFQIKEIDNSSSAVLFTLDADLNMMLRMIAKDPLTNFLNQLVERIEENL